MNLGDKYGCWTIKEFRPSSRVVVICDCGTISIVRKTSLKNNKTIMCRSCSVALSRKSHGQSSKGNVSSEYTSYTHMLQRCNNPNSKDYENYGARGIKVCPMWLESYEAFYMSMGPKPHPDYTIERIDYNKGYDPDNCIWADDTTQNRNRRCNVMIELEGRTQALSAWLQEKGLESVADAVYKRISRGMDPKEALLKVVKPRKKS